MNIRDLTVVAVIYISISGCYSPITGRVVDAETGVPIEEAIVLVEWTKKHGFGDSVTESFKVVEALSDKYGNVSIEGCNSPFVEPPDVTVYKKGYVAWSNRWIFPTNEKRQNFQWTKTTFRLELFKPEYSYIDHTSFIRSSINSSLNLESKKLIYRAFDWEDQLSSGEMNQKGIRR